MHSNRSPATPTLLAEEQLEDELRFQTLFEQAPFSMQLLAPDGRTLKVNKAWETLWGAPDGSDLHGYVLSEYNMLQDPQLQQKGITPLLQKAFAGEAVSLPAILYDPAEIGRPGNARWVSAVAHPVKGCDGQVREVMLIHEDVTARVEAERAVRESEERLHEGLSVGRMVVWEWSLKTQKVTYSPNALEVMGYQTDEVGEGWKHVHPDDVERLTRAINRAMEEKGSFRELTRRIRPDNGQIVWIDNRGKILFDEDGEPVAVRAINVDVTERIQAEMKLKEANRRKDEFLAMLAHELRNPLAPISTAAELLKRAGVNDKIRNEATDIIARQVKHMTELVDDLLDVSRVTRGLVELHRELLDLKAVVADAIEQTRPLMEARRHVLTTWIDAGRISVQGDRTRLIQVIVNLLNNAAKYTAPGGEIALRLEARDGQVILSIRDNGSGIDSVLLPHVFDLFTQGERTPDRSLGGLGIGLALVKNMVSLHGGQVTASSEGAGRGSTFTVLLPTADGTARSAACPPEPARPVVAPRRIMIVDDNQDAGQALAALLRLEGHEVSLREGAQSTLASLSADPPQVFILDIGLPDTNGYELARELRRRYPTHSLTLLALTGYGQPHDRVLSKAAGFDFHLVKPVDIHELTGILASIAQAGTR